jgi:hypothetical protein
MVALERDVVIEPWVAASCVVSNAVAVLDGSIEMFKLPTAEV